MKKNAKKSKIHLDECVESEAAPIDESASLPPEPKTTEKYHKLRVLNDETNLPLLKQTNDLSVQVDALYPGGCPEGTYLYYADDDSTRRRTSNEEKRLQEMNMAEMEMSLRKAAEVHKEVRSYIQGKLTPGSKLWDVCCDAEDKIRYLIGENGPAAGVGFPTGVSLNHVAAHYTPCIGDSTRLHYNDIMKLDMGTQVNGYIVDCAFTVAFNPVYDNLLLATRDATYSAIQAAGLDARLGELGGIIEEVINSYEVTIHGRDYPIVPVRNLSGHTIVKGSIHGDKCVPLIYEDSSEIMEEGDIFAIETFATTGTGVANPSGITSHYALNPVDSVPRMSVEDRRLYDHLYRTFKHLPFCRRWLNREDGGSFTVNQNRGRQEKCIDSLNRLVHKGVVEDYPPLCDKEGSYISQFEHTLLIKHHCKEVFSLGQDY